MSTNASSEGSHGACSLQVCVLSILYDQHILTVRHDKTLYPKLFGYFRPVDLPFACAVDQFSDLGDLCLRPLSIIELRVAVAQPANLTFFSGPLDRGAGGGDLERLLVKRQLKRSWGRLPSARHDPSRYHACSCL